MEDSKDSFLRCTKDGISSASDAYHTYNFHPHIVPLGEGVSAFAYRSRRGTIHVFINEALSDGVKKLYLLHELRHAMVDMPSMGKVIGIDSQFEKFEIQADLFMKEYTGEAI